VATELPFQSGKSSRDPFNEVLLDVAVTCPDGTTLTMPTFCAGENTWWVRFASTQPGTHRYRTICNDTGNSDLHGCEGVIEVAPYQGDNPLFQHGPLRMSQNRRHFEHRDGTPFLWLADTWWMGLCKRLEFPQEFQLLAADRLHKGFSVIQIVAGLYPDMPPFDPRGANEAGFPWTERRNWGQV
jgi:hypothetical protein